jgi:hypothetical protein
MTPGKERAKRCAAKYLSEITGSLWLVDESFPIMKNRRDSVPRIHAWRNA